jgi:hypothetical protein
MASIYDGSSWCDFERTAGSVYIICQSSDELIEFMKYH